MKTSDMITAGIILVSVWFIYNMLTSTKTKSLECEDDSCEIVSPEPVTSTKSIKSTLLETAPQPMPSGKESDTIEQPLKKITTEQNNTFKQIEVNNPYERSKEVLSADDLLPSTNNEFSEKNNIISPDLKNQNFLTHDNIDRYGINTIGSSLRNPSYDIRGTPPNPKIETPWSNSTIDYDDNLRHMVMASNE